MAEDEVTGRAGQDEAVRLSMREAWRKARIVVPAVAALVLAIVLRNAWINHSEYTAALSRGHEAAVQGLWDVAVASYQAALERKPRSETARGLFDDAVAAAYEAAMAQGGELSEGRRWGEAISAYRRALSWKPGDAEATRLLAEARRAEEARLAGATRHAEEARRAEDARRVEAARHAEAARRREVAYAEAMTQGTTAAGIGMWEEATSAFEAALEQKPGDAEATRLLAEARSAEEARRQRAYEAAMSRGRSSTEVNRWAEAILAFEAALMQRAGDAEATRLLTAARRAEEDRRVEEARRAEEERRRTPPLTLDLGRGAEMVLVYVPPGSFMMGSNDGEDNEKPVHEVRISRGFYMGKHSVTQMQYNAVMGANPSYFEGTDRPVERVSWHDAVEFCRRLSQSTGREVRLPTEAEWEYAARAGTTTRYCSGDSEAQLIEHAWFGANVPSEQPQPVGLKKPNAWGLHDIHGNVLEWVHDWYDADYYAKSPRQDPLGPASGLFRVVRGGAWKYPADFCRSAHRIFNEPSNLSDYIGFRVAVSSSPGP